MGKSLKPEYIKRLNIEESIQINELLKSKDYSNALSLASKAIRRNRNNLSELGRFQELKLKALLGLGIYDKVVELAFEYAYEFRERQFNFLMLELRAKICRGTSQEVLDELPNLFSIYTKEHINLENIKIDALISLDRYKEAFDEISDSIEKYPNLAQQFLNKKIQIYKKAKEYDLALLEIDKLEKEYPKDQMLYEKEKIKIVKEKRKLENNGELKSKKISASKLKFLLELDEPTFMNILKEMGMEEAVFLLSLRYKFQGSSTLALGCIDEYEKRAKEKTNAEFVKDLRKEIKAKKKIFDMREWTKNANKLGLNFEKLKNQYILEDYSR